MTLTRSVAALLVAGLVPAVAAAQAPPPVPAPPPAHARSSGGWLDHFEDSRRGPETTERWSKSFKVGPSGSLDLNNVSGAVVVTGGPGDEIKVDAVKRVRARDAGAAKALLGELTIEAVETAGRLEIRTVYPRGRDVHAQVDYTLQVPTGAAVAIHTVSGDVHASKVKGETRLESVSGSIIASGLTLVTKVKSVSGDVELTDGGGADGVSLASVSGGLVVRRFKARAIDAQTVSGDVLLEDVSCDRAAAKSISGDVHFEGPLAKSGRYEFTSHSGDVRLAVGSATGFEITANSFSGDVRSELPGFKPPSDDDGRPGRHEVRATIGDGSALIVVKTFSGDLLVTGPKK
jgi:DUF4097 and DUF4098 domain-containing protein YvlB